MSLDTELPVRCLKESRLRGVKQISFYDSLKGKSDRGTIFVAVNQIRELSNWNGFLYATSLVNSRFWIRPNEAHNFSCITVLNLRAPES